METKTVLAKSINNNLRNALFQFGYLPKEIPPVFDLKYFWDSVDLKFNEKELTNNIVISIPRRNSKKRRLVQIQHPILYTKTANIITNQWKEISDVEKLSTISISKTTTRKKYNEKIPLFSTHPIDKHNAIIKNKDFKNIFYFDIKNFYGSIDIKKTLTLVLEMSQQELNNCKLIWAKCLKELSILPPSLPIGPDTSRIISELIAIILDIQIQRDLLSSHSISGFRHVDDFYFYSNNTVTLHNFLKKVDAILSRFNLEINESKTEKLIIPEKAELLFRRKNKILDDNWIESSQVQLDWPHTRGVLLEKMITSPFLSQEISKKLVLSYKKGYPIDTEELKDYTKDIIQTGFSKNHDYEIIWALWTAYNLNIETLQSNKKAAIHIQNPLVKIVQEGANNSYLHDSKRMTDKLLHYWFK